MPGFTQQSGRTANSSYTDTHNNVKNGELNVSYGGALWARSLQWAFLDTYGEIGQRSVHAGTAGQMYEGFLQDMWRLRPNVGGGVWRTVVAGLMTPYYALWGNQSVFSPTDYKAAERRHG